MTKKKQSYKSELVPIVISTVLALLIQGLVVYFSLYRDLVRAETEVRNLKERVVALEGRYFTSLKTQYYTNTSDSSIITPNTRDQTIITDHLVYSDDFDGKNPEWIKPGRTFTNSFIDGKYILEQKRNNDFIYSTVRFPTNTFQTGDFEFRLTLDWMGGDKSARFGLLLYRDLTNVARFEVSQLGDGAISAKLASSTVVRLVHQKRVLNTLGTKNINLRVVRSSGKYSYEVNKKEVGKADLSDFQFDRVGVFIEGKQTVAFDKLVIIKL